MSAALHLAHAYQAPVKKRRPKRTGGGNGSKFADMAHRIYQDKRADTPARELLLACAYGVTMAPIDPDVEEWSSVWRAICSAIGNAVTGWDGLRSRISADLPRYEPPGYRRGTDPMDELCSGPRVRPHPGGPDDFRNRRNVCGAPARDRVIEKDLLTGWHTNHWFCTRHHDQFLRVGAQVKEQNEQAPAPLPNRGGLLPCYFDSDWLTLYRWALRRDTWEPPTYGLRADDWPLPGQPLVPQCARLRLVFNADALDSTP